MSIDDAEWDRWMSLSDAEQERELNSALRQHSEWWSTLNHEQAYRVRRRSLVATCAGWRRNIKMMDVPVFRSHLKRCQVLLANVRREYRGGVPGGEA